MGLAGALAFNATGNPAASGFLAGGVSARFGVSRTGFLCGFGIFHPVFLHGVSLRVATRGFYMGFLHVVSLRGFSAGFLCGVSLRGFSTGFLCGVSLRGSSAGFLCEVSLRGFSHGVSRTGFLARGFSRLQREATLEFRPGVDHDHPEFPALVAGFLQDGQHHLGLGGLGPSGFRGLGFGDQGLGAAGFGDQGVGASGFKRGLRQSHRQIRLRTCRRPYPSPSHGPKTQKFA